MSDLAVDLDGPPRRENGPWWRAHAPKPLVSRDGLQG